MDVKKKLNSDIAEVEYVYQMSATGKSILDEIKHNNV